MNYLLDTNVISELMKPRPNPRVEAWLREQSPLRLSLSVLVLGELEKGVASLARGKRQNQLTRWVRAELPRQFVGRLHAIDAPVAQCWGRLAATGVSMGRPLPVIDGLLLGTAEVAGLALATRNVSDCAGRGVPVFDPWTGELHI
jgi:toxin FitB